VQAAARQGAPQALQIAENAYNGVRASFGADDQATLDKMFADAKVEPAGAPGAVRAAGAMQIPVYSTLTDAQVERVARVVKDVLTRA